MSRNVGTIFKFGLSLCLAAAMSATAAAQKDKPSKVSPKPKVEAPKPPAFPEPPGVYYSDRETSEKAISVDPKVNIELCVAEGTLKINGWERAEVRVFVKNGRRIGMKVREKDSETGKPVWLSLVNTSVSEGRYAPVSSCLAGDSVEIDVPVKASINMEARTSGVAIDSVHNLNIKVIEGDISIRNIAGGIAAVAYQGGITVENAAGAIALESSTGNILAFDVKPGQVGDFFKAKTRSGRVSLQKIEHRKIEANSITGDVLFNGKFSSGGVYSFKTSNGSIRMLLPAETSCTLVASYGYGEFNSAFPLKLKTEIVKPGTKNIVAAIGEGESATLNITTNRGNIGIRKQPK